jgi:ribonucleotide reductase alpha subunit
MGDKVYTNEEAFNATLEYFKGDELAARVWVNKYAMKDSFGNIYERTPDDMHWRLADEIARVESKYPNPLSSQEIFDLLKSFEKDLATVYIVSQVELLESPDAGKTLSVEVKPADGCKCGRCWVYAKEGKTIDEGFVCQRCLSILEK